LRRALEHRRACGVMPAKEPAMPVETTHADRERELAALLDLFARQPEREWPEERRRVAVLQRMLAAEQAAA